MVKPLKDVTGFLSILFQFLGLSYQSKDGDLMSSCNCMQQQKGRGEFSESVFGRWKVFSRNINRIFLTFHCPELCHIASKKAEKGNIWYFLPLERKASSDSKKEKVVEVTVL